MRQIIIGLLTLLGFTIAFGQTKINLNLKKELDSIYFEDQRYRELLFSDLYKNKSDSIANSYKISSKELQNYLMSTMQKVDSSNMTRVEQILNQYNYPGKTLVGTHTNEAAFYVIQHSQYIDKYLPIIKKAADDKELPFKLYAMMLDRSLMDNGKEQIYGTQGQGFEVIDSESGKREIKKIIWPIKDASTVNSKRKKAGFDQTVEQNAKRLGIEYKVLTLQEVKKLKGQ